MDSIIDYIEEWRRWAKWLTSDHVYIYALVSVAGCLTTVTLLQEESRSVWEDQQSDESIRTMVVTKHEICTKCSP